MSVNFTNQKVYIDDLQVHSIITLYY